ncbi:YceI family protein [Ideonella sp.]|uniref:YceI family protein n=1 Tax=Ideonella sp. TaxID=1929293 RepID=UPI002BAABA64|nr:YceI family protein [Ramlibacter sp.]
MSWRAGIAALALIATSGHAAPVRFALDAARTVASFEVDAGVSTMEGRLTRSAGEVLLDREAGEGQVTVRIEANSLDFGWGLLNEVARGPTAFDTARFPLVSYQGRLANFVDGAPTAVEGELQMHGVTQPLSLAIQSFQCRPDAVLQREACSASALGQLKRDEFGIDIGKDLGMGMAVTLRIQIVALALPAPAPVSAEPAASSPSADGVPQ